MAGILNKLQTTASTPIKGHRRNHSEMKPQLFIETSFDQNDEQVEKDAEELWDQCE